MAEKLEDIQAAELDPARDLGRYPDLALALDYWSTKRGSRLAPSRSDIDPTEITAILPRILLADVTREAGGEIAFRYRLSGTGIGQVHGLELTGKSPLDLPPPQYGRLIESHYRQAVEQRRPLVHLIALQTDKKARSYARIVLPLSDDGETVNMLMIVDSETQNSLHEFLETIEMLGRRR
jgi:hypothetical protein